MQHAEHVDEVDRPHGLSLTSTFTVSIQGQFFFIKPELMTRFHISQLRQINHTELASKQAAFPGPSNSSVGLDTKLDGLMLCMS